MQRKINVRQLTGKQLQGTARTHRLVTDRTLEEGGSDAGCTSGELLLIAIGSCYVGSLRAFLEKQGLSCRELSADVFFEPHEDPTKRDRIVIVLTLDPAVRDFDLDAIKAVAGAGGVTSRIQLGSEIDIRISGTSAIHLSTTPMENP